MPDSPVAIYFGALAATRLTRAPGSQWEYSHFAMMVLSFALARRSGKDYDTLLHERLLVPLGMNDTCIAKRPLQVRLAQGHQSNALTAVPWDFPVDMAGVGGCARRCPTWCGHLEGEIGVRESEITAELTLTQQQVAKIGRRTMGVNWMLATVNGRSIDEHEGGTGGYSSFVAFDREAKRAVVFTNSPWTGHG